MSFEFEFDVVVVGGGPIGSTLAYEISKEGFSVCIFDKKKEIGIPLQCAGIVSKGLKEINEIPNDLILNKVRGAFIHSPNHTLKVEKNQTEAFIIDRIGYDKFLAKRAIDNGVKFFTKSKVIYVDAEKGIIGFKNNKKIKAKIIVGADGSNSTVSKSFNKCFDYFNGSQFLIKLNKSNERNNITENLDNLAKDDYKKLDEGLVKDDYKKLDVGLAKDNEKNLNENLTKDTGRNKLTEDLFNSDIANGNSKLKAKSTSFVTDFVDLFINSKTLPGFSWSIPISKEEYRIGLFSKDTYKEQNKLIINFLENNERFENYEIIEKYHGKIPVYDTKKKLAYKRAILIGDAASQLKPTTGGGLILGFEAVKIAKKYIKESLNKENISILKKYEESFRKKYSNELKYQIRVQKTLERLSDEDLDYMFFKLKEKDMEKLISKYGDMDKQSILVKEILKRGLIFSIIPSLIFNRVSKIWNLK